MTTPILGITEVANNQTDQYLTVNEAVRSLESSTNAVLSVDLTSADVTLTSAQLNGSQVFNCSGHTVARILTLPTPSPLTDRVLAVKNSGTAQIVVLAPSGAVPVLPNQKVILSYDSSSLEILSGDISVVDYTTLDTELSTSPLPEPGVVFIVGTGTGDFAGQDNNFAVSRGLGEYSFIAPYDGQTVRTKGLEASPNNARLIMFDADADAWVDV